MFYLFIIFFIFSAGYVFYLRIQDKKYLSKRTKDVLSKNVKKLIDKDREDFDKKRKKFEEALAKVQPKGVIKV